MDTDTTMLLLNLVIACCFMTALYSPDHK